MNEKLKDPYSGAKILSAISDLLHADPFAGAFSWSDNLTQVGAFRIELTAPQ